MLRHSVLPVEWCPLDELALFLPATSCTGPRSHSALTGADLLSRGAHGGLDQSSSYLVSLHTCAALCHVHTGGPPGHLCVCQCWGACLGTCASVHAGAPTWACVSSQRLGPAAPTVTLCRALTPYRHRLALTFHLGRGLSHQWAE